MVTNKPDEPEDKSEPPPVRPPNDIIKTNQPIPKRPENEWIRETKEQEPGSK